MASYIKERTKNAQFIVISLRNNMFELASRLVGVYKVNQMVCVVLLLHSRRWSIAWADRLSRLRALPLRIRITLFGRRARGGKDVLFCKGSFVMLGISLGQLLGEFGLATDIVMGYAVGLAIGYLRWATLYIGCQLDTVFSSLVLFSRCDFSQYIVAASTFAARMGVS